MARTVISTTSPLAVKHFNAGRKKVKGERGKGVFGGTRHLAGGRVGKKNS